MTENRIHISSTLPESSLVDPPKEKKKWRRPKWTDLSYTRRVTLAFVGVAVMTALVAIMVLSAVWERHFQSYTYSNMESVANNVAVNVGNAFEESGTWDDTTLLAAQTYASTYPNVGILVVDRNNVVHFDSTASIALSSTMSREQLAPASNTQMVIAPINVNDHPEGTVRVWVYGSDTLLSQTDIEFRNNSYRAMILAALLAIFLACIIGYIFAKNLVNPINRMTETAEALKEGDLTARTGLTGEDEIATLGETFDAMAESVQRERESERRLTTDVAHELRTPLMAIRATVEAMIDGVFEPDTERLETVDSEVMRLSRMVDALLKLSRLENRSTPLKLDVIDLGDTIEDVISAHETYVTDCGLTIEYKAEKNVKVKGDADLLSQATANLISNAIRYTPEGGSITVSVYQGEIMATIAVEDTGIGLTPEEAKQVFNRFWRSDEGRSRESGGLGIGLAVVKEIVDQHHGWVQVEGQKGQGARFALHVPKYDEAAEIAKKKEAERKAKDQAKKKAKQQAKAKQKQEQQAKQQAKAKQKQEQQAKKKTQQAKQQAKKNSQQAKGSSKETK